jgi:lysine N6-hydroxylase
MLHGHPEITNLFLDKRPGFGWHDGQQIPGATLQVSFFKDLVSLTQPTNAFSFLSYLHEQGKIYHFINAQFDAVPRQEFRNYLEWASRRNENITFGEEVLSVDFDGDFVVRTSARTLTARAIVVGIGNQPWIPPAGQAGLGPTQFHVCDFVQLSRNLGGKRVAVIGGGQSGAEAFLDLISRRDEELPRRVTWVTRRGNYFPIDDTPFTNEYYTPCYSDYFSNLDPAVRRALNVRNLLTSDGISEATLRQIYQMSYVHRFVQGREDLLAFLPNRDVTDVTQDSNGWDITVTHNDYVDRTEHIEIDVIVWATGFRPADMGLLASLEPRLARVGDEYQVDQDFAVQWDGPHDRNIFMQNAAREQRGLADPNLSLIAWRSQRILDRLRGARTNDQLSSFIEWTTKSREG